MPHLLRLMLGHLMVAMVAIALVGTYWHGLVKAGSPGPVLHAHSASSGPQHALQGQAEHKHSGPTKAHAAGQGCCHPACTVAIIPSPVGAAQALLPSAPVRSSPDLVPAPATPSGLDRPPKRA
ncbi:hypothetical protein [Microvirga soli]|uniref:hypothetical protein n=1 Tax=Microvirga soli TaxID=1854496 RepID=UPI0019200405|nr:hypothetical protein [Microvirga soli]